MISFVPKIKSICRLLVIILVTSTLGICLNVSGVLATPIVPVQTHACPATGNSQSNSHDLNCCKSQIAFYDFSAQTESFNFSKLFSFVYFFNSNNELNNSLKISDEVILLASSPPKLIDVKTIIKRE